jgi:hypothetical protein
VQFNAFIYAFKDEVLTFGPTALLESRKLNCSVFEDVGEKIEAELRLGFSVNLFLKLICEGKNW